MSLASQLANISAGNGAQVLDKKKKKKLHSVSLIYEPKEASGQDYETIFADAFEALQDLQVLDPRFKSFENSLFAETSISIDRQVQTQDQNDLLDKAVENFLSLVAPRINLQAALRALEWLVRRFQIHIHNAEQLILTVLPYYTSAVFVRVLDVVPKPLPQVFGFLEPTKQTAQSPPRNLMIRALTNDQQLYQLVSAHVLKCVQDQRVYHGLLAFWSSLSIWSMVSMKEAGKSNEDIVDRYLPVVSELLLKKNSDAQIAAYMVLSVIASQFRLDFKIKEAAIKSIAGNWSSKSQQSGLACITQLVKGDDDPTDFVPVVTAITSKINNIETDILNLAGKYEIQRFVVIWALSVFDQSSSGEISSVQQVLQNIKMSNHEISTILKYAIKYSIGGKPDAARKTKLAELFDSQAAAASQALAKQNVSIDQLELALQTSLSLNSSTATNEDIEMADPEADDLEAETVTQTAVEDAEKEIGNLSSGTVNSYLDINVDIEPYVAVFTNLVSAKKEIDISQFKLIAGSEFSFLVRVSCGAYPVLVRSAALSLFTSLIVKSKNVDYQALIPSLLVGLSDSSERVRRLSGSALMALNKLYPMKKPVTWGLDSAVYGKENEDVKFMTVDQVKLLLDEVVVPKVKECAMDETHIISTIRDAYTRDKKFGEALWQYMASHALEADIPQLKTVFLKLANRSGKNDVKAFTPLLESWIEEREVQQKRCSAEKTSFRELETQVVAIVTNGEKASINFLESAIKSNTDLANVAGEQIVDNWQRMRHDSQYTLIKFLVDLTVDESSEYDTMQVLNHIKVSCLQFVSILGECQLDGISKTDSPGVAKRRRRSSSTTSRQQLMPGGELASIAQRHLRKVTVVLELLERNNQLDPNAEILSQLFTILRDLLSISNETKLAVEYVQQVLGNCMVMVVKALHENRKPTDKKFDSSSIRIDIVVDCIRSSTSPQVQNRFLLLVAELATLDREIVLHGVMPIFTFMGANTVRKDDEYSAHILQHTVEKVIPALFGEESDKQDDIDYILTSFATALSHIPRHRRVRMFSTLIRTIGVDASFYRFLVLMGVKYNELRVGHHTKEAKTLAEFGESLCRTFNVLEQLTAFNGYLKTCEVVPLDESEINEEDEGADFNKFSFFKNALHFNSASLKLLKSDLYHYITEVIDPKTLEPSIAAFADKVSSEGIRDQCSEIIGLLLAQKQTKFASSDIKFGTILGAGLTKMLSILPIDNFVPTVQELVSRDSTELSVKCQALSLLRTRFEHNEHVNDIAAQSACSDAVAFCIDFVSQSGAGKDGDFQLVVAVLDGLDVMVARFGSVNGAISQDQFTALLDVATGEKGLTSAQDEIFITAVALTSSLCTVMGARMISHFAKIMPVVAKRFQSAIDSEEEDNEDESAENIQLASLALFAGMIRRIPAFMSSSLPKIMELVFKSDVSVEPRERLLETIVESVEFKHSFTTLAQTWTFAVENGVEAISLHLNTLNVVIDACRKKEFAPFAMSLVDMLLKAFEVRSLGDYELNKVNRIESMCINSGLKMVLKLNDKTFRPLFIRMVRWATSASNVPETSGSAVSHYYNRQITFYKFLVKVLSTLKQIITDYYGYLVDPVCDLLAKLNDEPNETVRRYVLQSLIASFQNDRDEFWQSQARFEKISGALLGQIPSIEPNLGPTLVKAITSLAEACVSPENNKTINDAVCTHIKEHCTVNEKIWGIRTLKGLYGRLGEEWVSMLPQLVPLIAELLEDDEEVVENEVRRELVPVVEEVLGESLDRYLS